MDRLYNIKHFNYISDIGKNMIELYIEPDEDLILYINSIPKLEPKIFINVNGHYLDKKDLFQCNFYSVVDNTSDFYNKFNANCIVFIIFTDLVGINFDFAIFPNAGIKQIYKSDDDCFQNLSPFNGSDLLPPLSYYNPKLRKIIRFKTPKKTEYSSFKANDKSSDSKNYKICKAEQITEPPLVNLMDTTPQTCGGGRCNVIEYFDDDCPGICKKNKNILASI